MLLNLYVMTIVFSAITIIIVMLYQQKNKEIFNDEDEDGNGDVKRKPKYSFVIEYDSSNKKHRLMQSIILSIVFFTPIINIIVGVAFGWYTLKMSVRHRNSLM